MTGPVGGMVTTLLASMTPQSETAVFLDEAKRRELLRGNRLVWLPSKTSLTICFQSRIDPDLAPPLSIVVPDKHPNVAESARRR